MRYKKHKVKAGRHVVGRAGDSQRFGNVRVGSPEIRDPLYNPETMYLPHSLQQMNMWIRHYVRTHPILGNCLDIHAYLPISDFVIQDVEDPAIRNFYEWIKEEKCYFYDWMLKASQEYEQMGEQFTYMTWNSTEGIFQNPVVLDPDLLDVFPFDFMGKRTYVIDIQPSTEMTELHRKHIVDNRYQELWNSLSPTIQNCITMNQSIPLSQNNIFAMQRLQNPYDPRGTSQIYRALKDLMHEDKLREAQGATADGYITPIQHWKYGDPNGGFTPDAAQLNELEELISNTEHANFPRYITNQWLSYQNYVPSGGMQDINASLQVIEDRIMAAMYTSRAWTTGDSPTYANSVVALKVLRGRYRNKILRFEKIIRDVYRRIAYAHGFVKRSQAELKHRVYSKKSEYVVPTIGWRDPLSFNENYDMIKLLMELANMHKISWQTVIDELGKDYEEEGRKIEKEAQSVYSDPYLENKINKILEGGEGSEKGTGTPSNLDAAPPALAEETEFANVPQGEPLVTEV